MVVHAQVVQKGQWPTVILGPGLNSHQSFGQWLKFVANLTNLTNLLSFNLGKIQLCLFNLQIQDAIYIFIALNVVSDYLLGQYYFSITSKTVFTLYLQ